MPNGLVEGFFFLIKLGVAGLGFWCAMKFASESKFSKSTAYLVAVGLALFFAGYDWYSHDPPLEEEYGGVGPATRVQHCASMEEERYIQGIRGFVILSGIFLAGTYCGLKQRPK